MPVPTGVARELERQVEDETLACHAHFLRNWRKLWTQVRAEGSVSGNNAEEPFAVERGAMGRRVWSPKPLQDARAGSRMPLVNMLTR